MHLPNPRGWHIVPVQVLPMRPGDFALGSPQSRAAARSLLVARKASQDDELRFQAVSIVDGSPVNFDGLAETIRAARLRARAGETPAPASDGRQKSNGGRGADCLSESVRKARARVGR
jgi:hypothetical protein